MTRGHGWRFLDVGRRLERAFNLTTLLRCSLTARPAASAMLDPLLEIADSSMTYRRRYFAQPQLAPVLDLLLADPSNARALVYQLMALSNHVDHLPRDPKAPSPTREQRLVGQTLDTLMQADLDVLCDAAPDGRFPGVTSLLESIAHDLRALSDVITYYYFSHAELRVS
jgi:uncharacterized alpha-E superfamily protein